MIKALPLTGLRVGLSVSESDDLKERGFTAAGMNRLTVRLSSALLAKGATLAFGHDWRQAGIMEAVCRGALDAFGYPWDEESRPLVLNLVPWPNKTEVRQEVLTRMPGVLAIREGGLPAELEEEARQREDAKTDPYFRARGLTHLRRRLAEETGARICLGGKERLFQGRYPGILEEALFTLEAGRPLYLVGLLGGAALHLGRGILDGEPPPKGFGKAPYLPKPEKGGRPLAELYQNWSEMRPPPRLEDAMLDLRMAWQRCLALGRDGGLERNRLSLEENRWLLKTDSEEEALHLVLTGLLRHAKSRERE
jgi:SLOG-like protein